MSNKEKKIGIVGLGVMGKPMAKNLVKAGFDLTVFDIKEEPVQELVGLGAKAADGEYVSGGSIIYRQRGTKIYPGVNVGIGSDDTLYAKVSGYVKFERVGRDKKQASVYLEK